MLGQGFRDVELEHTMGFPEFVEPALLFLRNAFYPKLHPGFQALESEELPPSYLLIKRRCSRVF
jgi:hypothetical protein